MDAANLVAFGGNAEQVVHAYLEWVAKASRSLRPLMRGNDFRRLIQTDRYWATLSNTTNLKLVAPSVLDEMRMIANGLEAAHQDIKRNLNEWTFDRTNSEIAFVVADTNVFLHHPQLYNEIDWHAELNTVKRHGFDAASF